MTNRPVNTNATPRKNPEKRGKDGEAQGLQQARRRKLIKRAIATAPLIVALPMRRVQASGVYHYMPTKLKNKSKSKNK